MQRFLVYILCACSALFWGVTFNVGKITVGYIPPLTTAALRIVIAGIFMLGVVALTEKDTLAMLKRNLRMYVVLGLVGVVGFNALFFIGLRFTSPLNGALIMATNPLVTALLAGLIFHQSINRTHKIGTTISFVGVVIVLCGGSLHRLITLNFSIGDLLIILADICLALYGVLGRHYLKASTPIMTTAISTTIAALVLPVVALVVEPGTTLAGYPPVAWWSLAFMALLGSGLAYVFWNYGIREIGASNTSAFFHLVPVFTVLASLPLGQTVTALQIVGGIIVVTGVTFATGVLHAPAPRRVADAEPAVAGAKG